MTASILQTIHLAQLIPAGEWYLAIPHPEQQTDDSQRVWAVDVYQDLSFVAAKTGAELVAVKPVSSLNRLIPLKLEFIPGLIEASAFNLLFIFIQNSLSDKERQTMTPQDRLVCLTLDNLRQALGKSLRAALTAEPEREETLYAAHDFLAYGVQARMRAAGFSATDHGEDETGLGSMTEEEE